MKFLLVTCALAAVFTPTLQQGPACSCVQEMGPIQSPTVLISNPQGDRMYLGTQGGIVYTYERVGNSGWQELGVFLNLTEIVSISPGYDERGFLSMGFHPDFENNRRVFLYYSFADGVLTGYTRLSEVLVKEGNPDEVDFESEKVILDIEQPLRNHNGGEIMWGYELYPEEEQEGKRGYLMLTVGDGGGAGDQNDNGQNTQTILGSLIMIDVDNVPEGATYGIPDENPWKGRPEEGLEEIFAYGLRNPWRNCIDAPTRRMFMADVGQNRIEEIDILNRTNAGANYGWVVYEGSECYNNDPRCERNGGPTRDNYEFPIYEYTHEIGAASVTGGFVYRGSAFPDYQGDYYFADWVRGTLGGLEEQEDGSWTDYEVTMCGDCSARNPDWSDSYARYIQTFGVDGDGEIYFAGKSNENSNGPGLWYRLIIDPSA